MLVDVRVHERFVEFVTTPSVTMPANPFNGDTVIVETPAAPAFTATLVGPAVTVKSWTTNVTLTECDRTPLVPVTDAR